MGKWRFQKSDMKTLTDIAYIDGYSVGDRMLEGVMFKITITDNNKFKAELADERDKAYTDQLNMKYWIPKVEEFCEGNDIFCDNPSGNGDEMIVFDPETKEECPNIK